MHQNRNIFIQACVAIGIVSVSASKLSALTVNPGDLLISFYQVSPTATSVEANTYVHNLGPASGWRETTSTTTLIANINTQLEAQFGAGWADDSTVRFLITGVVGGTDPITVGDPGFTNYYSRPITRFAPLQTAAWSLSSTQRGTLTTQSKTYADAMNGKPSPVGVPAGAAVASSINNAVTSFLPPIKTTYFGIGAAPAASFGAGNLGSAGSYNVEAALEVFRIIDTTSGADLTAHKSAGNATVGSARYIGTFTLDDAGNIRYDVPQAATSPYASWAAQNNLVGPIAAGNADPDKDGLSNGVEFVVGGNPNAVDPAAKHPTAAVEGGLLKFTFPRTDASVSSNPTVEHDIDLVGAWTTAAPGSGGVVLSVESDFFNATTDRVSVSIPVTGLKNFARLRVSVQ